MNPSFVYNRGICNPKEGLPIITRDRGMGVIRHINTGLYLIVMYASNDEIAFLSGGVEEGDTPQETLIRELKEEAGINSDHIISIEHMADWNFDVTFYSPHRNKNLHNKNHVFLVTVDQEDFVLSEEEQSIQHPHRWTLKQIEEYITNRRDNTNYESMEYLVSRIKNHTT